MVELNSFRYTRSILCTFVFIVIILLFVLVYFTGYEQSEWSFHPVSSIYSFLAVSWYKFSFFSLSPYDRDWRDDNGTRNKHSVNNTARIVCGRVCVIVCLSICLSHLPAAAACGWFAAVGPAGRRYWSIVAAASTAAAWRSAANAGSVVFTAKGLGWTQTCLSNSGIYAEREKEWQMV